MTKRTIIYRVVPQGAPATWDEDDLDMEQPCDLVYLEAAGPERGRRPFGTGHAASAYLMALIRGEK